MSVFSVDRLFYDPETGVSRDLIGLRELAQRLDVHYRTLLRAVHAERLQAVPVGRQWKTWREAVAEYLDTPDNRRLPTYRSTKSSYDMESTSAADSVWYDERGNPVPF